MQRSSTCADLRREICSQSRWPSPNEIKIAELILETVLLLRKVFTASNIFRVATHVRVNRGIEFFVGIVSFNICYSSWSSAV